MAIASTSTSTSTSSSTVFYSVDCPICLDHIEENAKHKMVITRCNHVFHETCLTNWIAKEDNSTNKICPMCREMSFPLGRYPGVDIDDENHDYIESAFVKAVRSNDLVSVMGMLKLTPSSEEISSHTQQPLDKETREARANAFGILHRNVVSNSSGSLLPLAARHGHQEMVSLMLKAGAHIEGKDGNGMTSLMNASERGLTDLARSLIKSGADIHARTPGGITAIFFAAKSGSIPIFEKLKKKGVDIFAVTNNGFTLMHAAAISGKVDMINLLYIHQLDINKQTTDTGVTPLHLAVINQELSAVQQLLNYRADPNLAAMKNNQSAFHDAIIQGNVDICRMLLDYGADINKKTKKGHTPLMMATAHKNIELVAFLLERGADKRKRTFNMMYSLLSYSAADLAFNNGDMEIYELLK